MGHSIHHMLESQMYQNMLIYNLKSVEAIHMIRMTENLTFDK